MIDDDESEGKKQANTIEQVELEGIMRLEAGRNVLRRIVEMSGYFDDTFDENPHKHAARAGMRRLGVRLMLQLETTNANLYNKMLMERTDERRD